MNGWVYAKVRGEALGEWTLDAPPCPFALDRAHDFDAHTTDGLVVSLSCRRCGLILPADLPIVVTERVAS